jgi:hypothetical protein
MRYYSVIKINEKIYSLAWEIKVLRAARSGSGRGGAKMPRKKVSTPGLWAHFTEYRFDDFVLGLGAKLDGKLAEGCQAFLEGGFAERAGDDPFDEREMSVVTAGWPMQFSFKTDLYCLACVVMEAEGSIEAGLNEAYASTALKDKPEMRRLAILISGGRAFLKHNFVVESEDAYRLLEGRVCFTSLDPRGEVVSAPELVLLLPVAAAGAAGAGSGALVPTLSLPSGGGAVGFVPAGLS